MHLSKVSNVLTHYFVNYDIFELLTHQDSAAQGSLCLCRSQLIT